KWHACQGQTNAAQHRLPDCSHDHTQSNAADCLTGQKNRLLTPLAGEPAAELAGESGRMLSAAVENRSNNDSQDKLDEEDAKATQRADEPRCRAAGVWRCPCYQRLDATGRSICPERGRLLAKEG